MMAAARINLIHWVNFSGVNWFDLSEKDGIKALDVGVKCSRVNI